MAKAKDFITVHVIKSGQSAGKYLACSRTGLSATGDTEAEAREKLRDLKGEHFGDEERKINGR